MTTEIMMTNKQFMALREKHQGLPVNISVLIRDVEQAVLQSPEIHELRKDALFGRVAMRFVDRAGDYCKEDPAEKICDEFNAAIHAAMEQQK